jgi:hypothetical protein
MKRGFFHLTSGSTVFLFLLICIVQGAWGASDHAADASANCNIQNGACVQVLGSGSVKLEVFPRPVKAMTDLTFQVILEGLDPVEAPGIDLGMPGMSMGPNHVTLEKTPEGIYTGTGVIVRCPSGKTLWKADVNIPGIGAAAFTFNVVY